eukprot:819601-Pyramimonas_sp.AAC.2
MSEGHGVDRGSVALGPSCGRIKCWCHEHCWKAKIATSLHWKRTPHHWFLAVGPRAGNRAKHVARSPLKCQAGFQNQDVKKDGTNLYKQMPQRVKSDAEGVETKTSENFGEELTLESCANLISMAISNLCAQPDFVVNDIGTIPGEDGGPGTFVWLATQIDESAPFGFGQKVRSHPKPYLVFDTNFVQP